jgi:hypothetical protein
MLRAELIDHERYVSRAAAIKSIGEYIDNLYDGERRHSHLGSISPSSSIALTTSTKHGIVSCRLDWGSSRGPTTLFPQRHEQCSAVLR